MTVKEKFRDFLDDTWEYIIKPFLALALCLALLVGVLLGVRLVCPEVVASNSTRAGIIVDKEFVGPTSGLFREKPAKYYITIQSDYEIKTGPLTQSGTITKAFSVDEETYRKAEIGMWFDTQTLEVHPCVSDSTGATRKTCRSCDNPVDADDSFCSSCGAAVNHA